MTSMSFDTRAYTNAQTRHIQEKITSYDGPGYIEFGGKPFGDIHAARVLPGYNQNCKADILRALGIVATIVMVVNARDILPEPVGRYPHGRIRGDSGLRYQHETIRLIREALTFGIRVDAAVLAVTPRILDDEDHMRIEDFRASLMCEVIQLHRNFEIAGYPAPSILAEKDALFARNDVVAEAGKHLVVFSPGGGSGKFGVILSEIYHAFKRGEAPNFIKFETFPVFAFSPTHPLNLAFEAATADLANKAVAVAEGLTSYDKDVENFLLLNDLYRSSCPRLEHPMYKMVHPTDMGVNIVDQAISDMPEIIRACGAEIARRCARYEDEYSAGEGKADTVARALAVQREFNQRYG